MSDFGGDLGRFTRLAERRVIDVTATTAILAHESIQTGSPISGAPGQPVDVGYLRNSIQIEQESDASYLISTNVEYAPAVEDATGPFGPRVYGAKNGIGGSHSFALTLAAGQPLVDEATRRVGGGT